MIFLVSSDLGDKPLKVDPTYDRLNMLRKNISSNSQATDFGKKSPQKVLEEDPEGDFEEKKFENKRDSTQADRKPINRPTVHENLVHLSKESSMSSHGPVVKLVEDDNQGHKLEYLNVVLNPEEGNFHLFKILLGL